MPGQCGDGQRRDGTAERDASDEWVRQCREHEVAHRFFEAMRGEADRRRLLSDEHFYLGRRLAGGMGVGEERAAQ